MTKTLFVRVNPRTGQQSFHRCGTQFTQVWQKLEAVDAATAARLESEQMLEVSETEPETIADAPNAADPAGEGEGTAEVEAPASAEPVAEVDPAKALGDDLAQAQLATDMAAVGAVLAANADAAESVAADNVGATSVAQTPAKKAKK